MRFCSDPLASSAAFMATLWNGCEYGYFPHAMQSGSAPIVRGFTYDSRAQMGKWLRNKSEMGFNLYCPIALIKNEYLPLTKKAARKEVSGTWFVWADFDFPEKSLEYWEQWQAVIIRELQKSAAKYHFLLRHRVMGLLAPKRF